MVKKDIIPTLLEKLKIFIDGSNKSMQKGFLRSISKNVGINQHKEYVNSCANKKGDEGCNSTIPTPIL